MDIHDTSMTNTHIHMDVHPMDIHHPWVVTSADVIHGYPWMSTLVDILSCGSPIGRKRLDC